MQQPESSTSSPFFYYVYRLQSLCQPEFGYTGTATNLKRRLLQHNQGENTSTRHFKPYRIHFAAAFPDKKKALSFEAYLKTGSGSAFAKKRLW